jgi:hypothetical protein
MIKDKLQNLLSESKIGDLLVPYRPDEHPGWTLNPDGSYDVDGDVNLSGQHLTKLPYKFRHVTRYFSCSYNQLTSLTGAPETVGGYFDCYNNQLTSLTGAPETVGGYFDCYNNQLTSLTGAPETVGGYFDCYKNKKKFSENDVNKVCKVKGEIYV